MSIYAYHLPLSYADALHLSHLQAQQYALERMCGLMRDDIMRAAFTDGEQAALQSILSAAGQRVSAGIVAYDDCKRDEPLFVDVGEAVL